MVHNIENTNKNRGSGEGQQKHADMHVCTELHATWLSHKRDAAWGILGMRGVVF